MRVNDREVRFESSNTWSEVERREERQEGEEEKKEKERKTSVTSYKRKESAMINEVHSAVGLQTVRDWVKIKATLTGERKMRYRKNEAKTRRNK